MSSQFSRNRVTWLAYLMLALYSYFLNIFGPITPFLKNELGLSYTVSSFHFSAFALGMIGAGLLGDRIIRLAGRWTALWIGSFGMSLAALLLIAGRDPRITIGASFLMGLVGSLILTVVPSTLADQHSAHRAAAYFEANVISSVLAAIAPVLVGWFAATAFGWRAGLVVGMLAIAAARLVFNGVSLPPAQPPAPPGEARPCLPRIFWVYWVGIVLAVSVEFCMVFWSADYFETALGMPKAAAAQTVSLFLAGMIGGRLAGPILERRLGVYRVIAGSLITAGIGFAIYWTASAPLIGMLGLFITGLGVAGLYPLTLSLAVGSAGGATVQASALSSMASGLAIFALPLILGRLADAVGIRQAYAVIIVLVVADLAIILAAARFGRRLA